MVNSLPRPRRWRGRLSALAARTLSLASKAGDAFLPAHCALCGHESAGAPLCRRCLDLLKSEEIDRNLCCARCALPLYAPANAALRICPACTSEPPAYSRCVAANRYAPLTARLLNGLKHRGQRHNASALAMLLTASLQRGAVGEHAVDLLLPVPLHRSRLRQRGFNQAVEIARPLSASLSIPMLASACTRRQQTTAQQGLGRAQRARNLGAAFHCDARVCGRRVAIIDDVMTTGSTANAVARSAILAGASDCEVWCVARTPAPGTGRL